MILNDQVAFFSGREENVELLLANGLDPSRRDLIMRKKRGFHILHLRGECEALKKRKAEIVSSLVRGDKKKFFTLITDFPLHTSMEFSLPHKGIIPFPLLHLLYGMIPEKDSRDDFLKTFLELSGADVNVRGQEGETIIHLTALRCDSFALDLVDVCVPDHRGVTSLHLFAQEAAPQLFQKVLSK